MDRDAISARSLAYHRDQQCAVQWIKTEIEGSAYAAKNRMGYAAGNESNAFDHHVGTNNPATNTG